MDNAVMNKHAIEIAFARNWRPQTDDDKCVTELAAEIVRLCQQIAELEPDAKLGRMVREMPIGAGLAHCDWTWAGYGKGEWVSDWPIGEDEGVTVYNRQYGDSAKAAMEAAQKKEH